MTTTLIYDDFRIEIEADPADVLDALKAAGVSVSAEESTSEDSIDSSDAMRGELFATVVVHAVVTVICHFLEKMISKQNSVEIVLSDGTRIVTSSVEEAVRILTKSDRD